MGVVLDTDGGSHDVLISGVDRDTFTELAAAAGYLALRIAAELVQRSEHN